MADADALEDTLRSRQRSKARQGKTRTRSYRFRKKAITTPQDATKDCTRDSSETKSYTEIPESEDELHQIYITVSAGRESKGNSRSSFRDEDGPSLCVAPTVDLLSTMPWLL
ncbi:Hypothetical protein PHPALM_18214 [Phytophthora palmivora]|uniref:Uncharacterized protein n=1 Tax=Phytophthora palmivora TaxID=4796 RepID=A0A2P4XKD4_9STRA|nr:Hypothetical protein PHPALM_18214 [Phytophthora palmivora]